MESWQKGYVERLNAIISDYEGLINSIVKKVYSSDPLDHPAGQSSPILGFKSSIDKKSKELRFMPINLFLQRMQVIAQENPDMNYLEKGWIRDALRIERVSKDDTVTHEKIGKRIVRSLRIGALMSRQSTDENDQDGEHESQGIFGHLFDRNKDTLSESHNESQNFNDYEAGKINKDPEFGIESDNAVPQLCELQTISVGAFAAHTYKFDKGGLHQLLEERNDIKSMIYESSTVSI